MSAAASPATHPPPHPTARDEPAVEVHDLTVAYRTQPVLWDVDVRLPEGKLIAIAGPNGAGKSTLLKTILGLVRPITGWVRVFGRSYDLKDPLEMQAFLEAGGHEKCPEVARKAAELAAEIILREKGKSGNP